MGGEDFGLLELILGIVSGAFTMLLMSLLVGVISSRSRKNKEKQKELIGKAVAHMMGKVNELFIAYRLGDLAFEQMERESREYISKITDDINENNGQLSSAYVAVVTRYIEEKTEMLIAIKEDFHHYNTSLQQETVGRINTQPATQVPVHPTTHDTPAVDPLRAMTQQEQPFAETTPVADNANTTQTALPTMETNAPVIEEAPFNAQQIEPVVQAQEPVVASQETSVMDLDLAETFAASEETSATDSVAPIETPTFNEPVVETQSNESSLEDVFDISLNEEALTTPKEEATTVETSQATPQTDLVDNSPFGDMDFSATQEFAKEDLQVSEKPVDTFELNQPQVAPVAEPPVAAQSIQAPSSDSLAIETDEFTSAIDNAFDLGGMSSDNAPIQSAAPTAQEFAAQQQNSAPVNMGTPQANMGQSAQPAQPAQQTHNPFQGFETPSQSGFQSPSQQINSDSASKFSLNGDGNLDVEATQEFNLNDIMSQAQDIQENPSSQQGGDDMVSGDDVASKLDSFFS